MEVENKITMKFKRAAPNFLTAFPRLIYRRMLSDYDRYFYERPSPLYRRNIAKASSLPDFLEYATALCERGIVVIPNFFGQECLSEMRMEFERLVKTNPPNAQAQKENSIHISTSRFNETAVFGKILFEPNMLRLVQYYWGRPVVLNGTGGTRYEPAQLEDRGSNQWHHDGKRKQVRVFIFLTDVPKDGQCTKYISGSHKKYHYDLVNSRLDKDAMPANAQTMLCSGPAGSIAIIDTNGAHRANRNNGPRRDTWNFSFRAADPLSAKLNPVPTLHPAIIQNLTMEQRLIARIT
tara:strand:- start:1158 stop:2036 length:879 start_codon:yes stop_codon:yes gene_type:complete